MTIENFDDVARFVRSSIDSVGQLEILLFLHEAKGEARSARQINDALRSSLSSVENRLGGLQNRGIVAAEGAGSERRYRFAPTHEETTRCVDRLADLYHDYRGRIIDLIFSPRDQMRNFSDAFRIKNREEEGDA